MVHPSPLTDQDLRWFGEGTHHRLYEKMGPSLNREGCHFAVWAPGADAVSVIGSFNGWEPARSPLLPRSGSGVWEGFVPGVRKGDLYKYRVESPHDETGADKADPFALFCEEPPRTASVVWDLHYRWIDGEWMARRRHRDPLEGPLSIYEVHLGSWMRSSEGKGRFLTYRELAPRLARHVLRMGFTHVELLPVMEHPFYGSWGYQTTGYFAPSSRYGSPQDFMFLVDHLHRNGIGVILDWAPSHFPRDGHGLGLFDGTPLYEHPDPRMRLHPDWHGYIFHYGRNEVRSFLVSSALFWLDRYHVDGLRVDAVASMLYLDYSRSEGEWVPNIHGGRENLDAVRFLKTLNTRVRADHPGACIIAEESTTWPGVSHPPENGGLGFSLKWDMGWTSDTLEYMSTEPVRRALQKNRLARRMDYAYSERFTLALSHDEVANPKRSLLERMPGDLREKLANLRLLYAYMFGLPGKKLLFMGAELGQRRPWSHEGPLDWHLLEEPAHDGVLECLRSLNRIYRTEPALYELELEPTGFSWADLPETEPTTLAFLRHGRSPCPAILAAYNFSPTPCANLRIGVPEGGSWTEIFNSDAEEYGGSGMENRERLVARKAAGPGWAVTVTLPPLAALFLKSADSP